MLEDWRSMLRVCTFIEVCIGLSGWRGSIPKLLELDRLLWGFKLRLCVHDV